ncbi:MAG: DMT family transporter, partial [Paracoccaceae bacterium]
LTALLAFAVFSVHDVVVKFLGGVYSPFQIIFFSVLFSFPLITMMLMRDPTPGNLRPVHPWWIAFRTVAGVTTSVSAYYAFSVLPLAQIYAVLFAAPLLITVLSIPILGERVRLRRWLAVIVGLVGVLIVLRPGSSELGLGHLAALSAAFGIALASIIVRKVGRQERAVVLLLYPIIANFVLMAIALPFVYQPMPITDLGLVGIISLFSFGAGLLLIVAYKNAEAAIVAPMQYSQIIWAAIFGFWIFDERIDPATMLGAGIVILSGLYIVLRESRASVSDHTPVLRTRTRFEFGSTFRISPMLRRGRTKK